MLVVIVGPYKYTRNEDIDHELVKQIIADCQTRFSKLVIVTKSTDKGVGKIVKDICTNPKALHRPVFDMIEVSLRHILIQELPRNEFLEHFNAINASLIELGDEFHLLTEEHPSGAMLNMLDRVRKSNLPYVMYKPSESKNGPKRPSVNTGRQSASEEVK